MPALVAGIHAMRVVECEDVMLHVIAATDFATHRNVSAWVPGTRPGMTPWRGCGVSPPSFETHATRAPQDEGFWWLDAAFTD
jgi:hypothetical protein